MAERTRVELPPGVAGDFEVFLNGVRQVAEAHHGRVDAERAEDGGTVMKLKLGSSSNGAGR